MTSDLIKAVETALDGTVTHDGSAVTVYVRGHVGDAVPCIVIERPRTEGSETMDRDSFHDARLRLRVHDRKDADGFYALRAPEIADKTHAVLSPSLDIGGSTVAFLQPDETPIEGYEAEGSEALDHQLTYDLFLP